MTRRWLTIAEKDFQYTRRSNVLLAVIAVFALLTLGIVTVPGLVALAAGEPMTDVADIPLFEATATAGGFIIPITALVAAYLSIAGERESGRIRILLGMPPTRRDIVVGKFVARSAVVLLAIGVAYVLAMLASVLLYQDLPVQTALGTTALVGLLGVVFVAIGVGISAFAASRARAVALVLVFYVVTIVLWDVLIQGGGFLATFFLEESPDWLAFVETLSPSSAFSALYDELVGALGGPLLSSDAFYRSVPFLLALLLAWILAPLVVGYLAFERADLS